MSVCSLLLLRAHHPQSTAPAKCRAMLAQHLNSASVSNAVRCLWAALRTRPKQPKKKHGETGGRIIQTHCVLIFCGLRSVFRLFLLDWYGAGGRWDSLTAIDAGRGRRAPPGRNPKQMAISRGGRDAENQLLKPGPRGLVAGSDVGGGIDREFWSRGP